MLVVLCLGVGHTLQAQTPNVHYLHHGVMPPGAIGSQQRRRREKPAFSLAPSIVFA
jgi:hypothetical protein